MPTYVALLSWTEKGIASYRDSPARAEDMEKSLATAGGSIKKIFYTMGPYDAVLVIEASSDEVYNRVMLHAASKGHFRSLTLKAWSEPEFTKMVGGP